MMNRTRRLMTAVATSLLLSGTVSASDASRSLPGQSAQKADESWKTDPNVEKAAGTILDWLAGTAQTSAQAKRPDEIGKALPTLGMDLVGRGLQRLIWEGEIKRTGDGNGSSPYRYYIPRSIVG
jgi:hypothetical protein